MSRCKIIALQFVLGLLIDPSSVVAAGKCRFLEGTTVKGFPQPALHDDLQECPANISACFGVGSTLAQSNCKKCCKTSAQGTTLGQKTKTTQTNAPEQPAEALTHGQTKERNSTENPLSSAATKSAEIDSNDKTLVIVLSVVGSVVSIVVIGLVIYVRSRRKDETIRNNNKHQNDDESLPYPKQETGMDQ